MRRAEIARQIASAVAHELGFYDAGTFISRGENVIARLAGAACDHPFPPLRGDDRRAVIAAFTTRYGEGRAAYEAMSHRSFGPS